MAGVGASRLTGSDSGSSHSFAAYGAAGADMEETVGGVEGLLVPEYEKAKVEGRLDYDDLIPDDCDSVRSHYFGHSNTHTVGEEMGCSIPDS